MGEINIKVIEPQQSEIKNVQIFDWEAQQLMQKYGIKPEQVIQPNSQSQHSTFEEPKGLTFDEMCRQEEFELKRQEEIKRQRYAVIQQQNGPMVNYITDDDTGFNYRVEIRMEGMNPPKF